MNYKVLIYGGRGWIGQQIFECLEMNGINAIISDTRVNLYDDILDEIQHISPTHVICCIGKTSGIINGKDINSIDYLEYPDKLCENIHNNLYAPNIIANVTYRLGIHMTYIGTGCIFQYNTDEGDYKFIEEDYPNFSGSSYSIVKGFTDTMMRMYDNVLNVRIRMPISYKSNPREFITKIVSYNKICSIPNSMTVLDDLIPIMLDMSFKNETGTINLVNPGVIEHNEILQMYREIINPMHNWENVNYDDQIKLLLSHRSNNHLNTEKLQGMYPNVMDIHTSIRNVLLKRKSNNL